MYVWYMGGLGFTSPNGFVVSDYSCSCAAVGPLVVNGLRPSHMICVLPKCTVATQAGVHNVQEGWRVKRNYLHLAWFSASYRRWTFSQGQACLIPLATFFSPSHRRLISVPSH